MPARSHKLRKQAETARHLASLAGLFCLGCSGDGSLLAGSLIYPDTLDFGVVAMSSEASLPVDVHSTGTARLVISSFTLEDTDPTRWRVSVDKSLGTGFGGLEPENSAPIVVTYRPCPSAWDHERLKNEYPFDTCERVTETARLVLHSNGEDGQHVLTLLAESAAPPRLTVGCAKTLPLSCNASEEWIRPCQFLDFGYVNPESDDPCDRVIEVANEGSGSEEAAELLIEAVRILVRRADDGTMSNGSGAGFSLINANGRPMAVGPDTPIRIAIPQGAMAEARRFRIRFDGSVPGHWIGNERNDLGLTFISNDPRPFTTVTVLAQAAAPKVNIDPEMIDFGPTQPGENKTEALSIRNDGDVALRIEDIRLEPDYAGNPLRLEFTRSIPFTVRPNDFARVLVQYFPRASGIDAGSIVIQTNDPESPDVLVPVFGGSLAEIEASPNPVVFNLPNPTSTAPVHAEVTIRNTGLVSLSIQGLEVTGPAASTFSTDLCATLPCAPNVLLCSPSSPNCQMSEILLELTHNPDDPPPQQATLRITSNDITQPTLDITLTSTTGP